MSLADSILQTASIARWMSWEVTAIDQRIYAVMMSRFAMAALIRRPP